MDGDVVFLGCAGKREGMILPQRNLWAAQKDVLLSSATLKVYRQARSYLASLCFRMLFLDLNFADIAGMLNDLGNVCLVSSSNLTGNTLTQVGKSPVHPIFPEDANTIAKGGKVGFDHAKSTMDGPEHKEDDEQVVGVPEPLELCSSWLLSSGPSHGRECDQHDISRPSRACGEIGKHEAHESKLVVYREDCQISPMRNGMQPREK